MKRLLFGLLLTASVLTLGACADDLQGAADQLAGGGEAYGEQPGARTAPTGAESGGEAPTGLDDAPLTPDTGAPLPTGITNFGAGCIANTDCLNAATNQDVVCLTGISGGYCTIACQLDAECGSTARCGLEPAPNQLFCGLECAGDADCARPSELGCDVAASAPICMGLDMIPPDVIDDTTDGPDIGPDAGSGVDDPVPAGVSVGTACSADTGCAIGSLTDNRCFTSAQGWPSGYCAAFGCLTDTDCGGSGFCSLPSGAGAIGLCLRTCTGTSERVGYQCITGSPTLPGLLVPSNLPDPLMDLPNVGESCVLTDQCTMGTGDLFPPDRICIPPRWPDGAGGFPDGYCTGIDCTAGLGECGTDALCITIPPDETDPASTELNLCMASCAVPGTQSTCRTGYTCIDVSGPTGVCAPE